LTHKKKARFLQVVGNKRVTKTAKNTILTGFCSGKGTTKN
jgi:hypothetical protein